MLGSDFGDYTSYPPFEASRSESLSMMESDETLLDKGIAVIESILDPDNESYHALSDDQRIGLDELKRALLVGFDKEAYIPRALLNSNANQTNARYLLSNFGGVRESSKKKIKTVLKANIFVKSLQSKAASAKSFGKLKQQILKKAKVEDMELYIPDLWLQLPKENQKKLREILSWDHLKNWDYPIFDLNELTMGNPLLFMGWAILASPQAQHIMDQTVEHEPVQKLSARSGYKFIDKFKIPQRCLWQFLKRIEKEYRPENPYHNRIHGADVTQTLNALLQMGGKDYAGDSLHLLAVLVSAVVHDVGHPGFNNNYQANAKTDFAIRYNDRSILENMHVARTFELLLGQDRDDRHNILANLSDDQLADFRKKMIDAVLHTDMTTHFTSVAEIKGIVKLLESHQEMALIKEDGILEVVGNAKRTGTRSSTRSSSRVSGMSSSSSFSSSRGSMASLNSIGGSPPSISKLSDEQKWHVLGFLLHIADISNPAKGNPTFIRWADLCLEEFFRQGDVERRQGLPVSPLCDRETTERPGSQIGFIKFVILPAYEVTGRLLFDVDQQVLPQIKSNMDFWYSEKERETQDKKAKQQKEEEMRGMQKEKASAVLAAAKAAKAAQTETTTKEEDASVKEEKGEQPQESAPSPKPSTPTPSQETESEGKADQGGMTMSPKGPKLSLKEKMFGMIKKKAKAAVEKSSEADCDDVDSPTAKSRSPATGAVTASSTTPSQASGSNDDDGDPAEVKGTTTEKKDSTAASEGQPASSSSEGQPASSSSEASKAEQISSTTTPTTPLESTTATEEVNEDSRQD